jgi:hypothetical protein
VLSLYLSSPGDIRHTGTAEFVLNQGAFEWA